MTDERNGARNSRNTEVSGNRNEMREPLVLMARMRLGRERAARDVKVRNLSANGLMIERDSQADVGTPVWLEIDGVGDITGKLAWSTEGRMGIALDTSIDLDAVREAAGRGR